MLPPRIMQIVGRLPRVMLMPHRNMFIQSERTPNENSLKFKPGLKILDSGSVEFNSFKEAQRSPLAVNLFKIQGLKSVFIGSDFITVTKDESTEWQHLKPAIFSTIMDFFSAPNPVVISGETQGDSSGTAIHEDDSETVQMIKV